MTQQVLTAPAAAAPVETVPVDAWESVTLQRVPGIRMQGRYEGGGYTDDRFLVVRPDGQPVLLTELLYLVVRHADGGTSFADVADRVGEDYGRRLPREALAKLVRERLQPSGLLLTAAGPTVSAPAGRAAPRAEPFLSVTLSQALIPRRAVGRLAAWLAPLFHPAMIVAGLAAFAAADGWLFLGPGHAAGSVRAAAALVSDPVGLLAVLALMVISTLFHELGHAAGCRYGAGRPGAIGAGLYLWFLVFWTDVTDAYRLDRPGRLRTDLGGIYFNALFIAAGTVGYALTGWAPLAAAVILTNLLALQQLLPVIRMDGYYILGDLTGVPNLFGLLRPILRGMLPGRRVDPQVAALRPGVRRVVAAWSVISAVTLTGSLIWLVVSTPGLISSTWAQIGQLRVAAAGSGSVAGFVVAWLLIVFLVLPFAGFAALVVRAARRARPTAVKEDTMSQPAVNQPPVNQPPEGAPPAQRRYSAADFTEDEMLHRSARPPAGGWRRGVFRASGGLVNPGPSAADRRREELVARVRTRVTSPRRIVVLSRKGGAGKTTTTVMLGHTLAVHRGDRVIALDANPDAGSLPYRVERESSATITSLLADADRLSSYAQLRAHTSQAPSRLEIVASDDDPKITHALGQADYTKAIRLLETHYMLLLMDTGTGILDEATQGLLREADQIVLVMPPALDGARVAASTLDWLDEHGYRDLVRGAIAVINGVRDGFGLVQLEQVEEHFRARCAGVVQVPWDRSLEAGACTNLEDLKPLTRTAYLELAALVAEGFRHDGRRTR